MSNKISVPCVTGYSLERLAAQNATPLGLCFVIILDVILMMTERRKVSCVSLRESWRDGRLPKKLLVLGIPGPLIDASESRVPRNHTMTPQSHIITHC